MNRRYFTTGCLLAVLLVALPIFADSPTAHRLNDEAVALSDQRDYVRAFEKITLAWRLEPRNEVIRDNRVQIGRSLASERFERGERISAIRLLEQLQDLGGQYQTKLQRQLAVLYNNYAVWHAEKNNYEAAERMFTTSGNIAYRLGDSELYRELQGISSKFLTSWGQELFTAGKGEMAKVKLLQALRQDDRNADACKLLSKIHFDDGDYRQAEYFLQWALKVDPEDPETLEQLSLVRNESRLDGNLRYKKSGKFRVEFSGMVDEDLATAVLDILNDARGDIGRRFDFYPEETLLVKIYDSEHASNLNYGPHWAAGVYDGKIRVKAEDVLLGGSALKDVLYHEYTHAVLYFMTHHNIPTWLNEGLAQYCEPHSGPVTQQESRDFEEILNENVYVSMSRLSGSFVELSRENAQQVYLQSKMFVDFLMSDFDRSKMIRMLKALGTGMEIEQAAGAAYGYSISDLEAVWLKSWI